MTDLVRDFPVPEAPALHPGVTIALASPCARFSLRARSPEGYPGSVLASAAFGGGNALCLGPDEWLLLLPEDATPPEIAGLHALTDIGHRNIGLTVEGPQAVALLLTGCALDLDRAFPTAKVTRTLYEGVEIILWRTGETRFHIEVWRSFAAHLWAALDLAAGDLAAFGFPVPEE